MSPDSISFSEPDITLEDITNGRIARIVEETRMRYLLQLDEKTAAGKLKRECIASQVRNEMQRDGVLSTKIKDVGVFKLYPPKAVTPCESCMAQFGFGGGTLDPYLFVSAA